MGVDTNYNTLRDIANLATTMEQDYSKLESFVKNRQSLTTDLSGTIDFFAALPLHYFYCTDENQIAKIRSILIANLPLFKPHFAYDTIFVVTSEQNPEVKIEVRTTGLLLALKSSIIESHIREAATKRESSTFFKVELKEFTDAALNALANGQLSRQNSIGTLKSPLPPIRLYEIKDPDKGETIFLTRMMIARQSPRTPKDSSPRTPSRLSREINRGSLLDEKLSSPPDDLAISEEEQS